MSRINWAAPPAPPVPRLARDAPAEGTDARLVYDLLREHAGRRVPDPEWAALDELVPNLTSVVGYLRRAYALEIYDRRLVSEPGPRVYYA